MSRQALTVAQRRANNDLDRNSLVATFLRALESFEGMLFLTTNRVGAFDDAFVSRIHVKLYYPPLRNEDRQKIWTSFVNKLTRERRNEIYVTREAKDYIKGKTIRELDLNGREIRNAFQTAVALAEYDQHRDDEGLILVEDSHIEQVAEMTQEFQEYLTKLHGKQQLPTDVLCMYQLTIEQKPTRRSAQLEFLIDWMRRSKVSNMQCSFMILRSHDHHSAILFVRALRVALRSQSRHFAICLEGVLFMNSEITTVILLLYCLQHHRRAPVRRS